MSDSFRDLERPDAANRKDAVLMATISGLEYLDPPSRQDLARFSRLFIPLYSAANTDVRRTASAALSRLPRVPDDVAEMLINEPIEIAAPFIAHYPGLKESALAAAIRRHGAPHARAAARRSDLSPKAIAALRGLGDPSVEGLLVLRGLIPDPAKNAPVAQPFASVASAKPLRPSIETPPLDPSEKLRAELKALALRSPTPKSLLNRPTSTRKPQPAAADRDAAAKNAKTRDLPASAATRRRMAEVRLSQLARHALPDHEFWFATALADAMESSYALAERIMMDLSGRQLATALIGLGAAPETIKSALESFFPHLSQPSTRNTLASDIIGDLDAESCQARLAAWQRADKYTTDGQAVHVPALADSKPVRPSSSSGRSPQPGPAESRKSMPGRETA